MKSICIAILLCLTISQTIFAQNKEESREKYAQTITKEDLSKHLHILASDKYEGRETGKKGQKMAAEYIAKAFNSYKLTAPVKDSDNPNFQHYDLTEISWATVFIKNKNTKLELLKDFLIYQGETGDKAIKQEVVFAGYGIDSEKYSDYKKIDVKGKMIVVLDGEPQNKKGIYWATGTKEPLKQDISAILEEKGALGVIMVQADKDYKKMLDTYGHYFTKAKLKLSYLEKDKEKENFSIVYSSQSAIAKLFKIKTKKLNKVIASMNKKGVSVAGKFKTSAEFKFQKARKKVVAENVLGYMEGTDKKEELLVLTAHYDHIGIDDKGRINNGADDDGSGTVAILELAEAFSKAKEAGFAPRRSILFMTVSGEEKGLLGSQYYSDHAVFEIENTITNLNIDMIGRVDPKHEEEKNSNYVYIIGSNMLSTELHNLSETVGKKYASDVELDYRYNSKDDPNRFYYRSDHYNFAKHGVPVIFYFNGTHADYHKHTDTVEKIDFDKMEKITRLVFHTAWELANRDEKVKLDK